MTGKKITHFNSTKQYNAQEGQTITPWNLLHRVKSQDSFKISSYCSHCLTLH
uniref:Uncharacterized protein n=1 Tax=Anguilla anguilla TaxID=7936 RepID=A0A0E9S9M8_ANGAN